MAHLLAPIAAIANGGSLTGTVRYSNADSTALSFSKVILWDNANTRIDSMYCDNQGIFTFNGLSAGTYHITARPIHPWGGVNSADALSTLKHFTHMSTLHGIYLQAADVNGAQGINSLDAFLIQRRFALLLPYFPIDDWVTENKVITLGDNETRNVTIHVLCAGDVNGSHSPNNNGLPCAGMETFEYGGQTYHTVQIGSQCWMKENLNIGTMVNGGSNQTNNSIIEKYCYGNNLSNCAVYGGLYQWREMMQYTTTPGVQGICPSGWHIPMDSEWCTLTTYLDTTVNCNTWGWSGTNAGGKMKETGTNHWYSPNTGATNESGFSALGAGARFFSGDFISMAFATYIWSSSEYSPASGIHLYLLYNYASLARYDNNKTQGLSVRCIKD